MSENIFVQRLAERFGDLNEADAVLFAHTIMESANQVSTLLGDSLSVPSRRELNLALVFMNMKYPMQCCGRKYPNDMCEDCPMRKMDICAQENSVTA